MENCQIFTPPTIVNKMLNMIGYTDDNIATNTILEPSFGDGAFLVPIVQRILQYGKQNNKTADEIIAMLGNVYGVELDKKYFDITKQKLSALIQAEGLDYDWPNLYNGDTLTYNPPIKFDFCIGNPPYIRVHDCSKETRQVIKDNYVMGKGNTDLYIIFYEKGIQCLKETGALCYIAPNSYFKNSSQKEFRKYLTKNNLVEEIVDYGTVKVFGAVDTYTAITLLKKKRKSAQTKYSMMESLETVEYSCLINLATNNGEPWIFNSPATMKWIDKVKQRSQKLGDLCEIQFGIATNADSIYVISQEFAATLENEIVRPVVKASKLTEGKYIIFPYEWNQDKQKYVPIEEGIFQRKYPKAYRYLERNKTQLMARDMEKNIPWYAYARSQGLQNSQNKKIAIKHILSPESESCEIKECNEQTLVFSGIYIIVKDLNNYNQVLEILRGKELYKYLFTIGKNMSGGYKNVNAKAIKSYGIPESKEKLSQK